MYEFRSDGGDEYNFRAVSGESPRQAAPCPAPPEILVNNGLQATWRFRQNVAWPQALQSDKKQRAGNANMSLITELTLYQSHPRLDVCFKTENKFQDYRLRVLLPTSITSSTITSEGDFGWDTRPVKPIDGYRRHSYSLPQGVFSFVADQEASLIIANQGLTEIEPVVMADGTVTACVTLLRCIGELGDWGYFPTPEAQCPGSQSAEFSLIPSGPAVDLAAVWPYVRPLWSMDSALQSGSWPLQRSFLPDWPPELVLTAVKKAEKRSSLMVRGFNHTANKVLLPPLQSGSTVYFTNLLEQRQSRYSTDSCAVSGHKIFTLEQTRRP
jgi:alpha-mannosidase